MAQNYIVIDTDAYAGNFERSLVAYMTGMVGDCTVGSEIAKLVKLSDTLAEWVEINVYSEPDEHGCHRPAKIVPTPGWWNNGRGGHFRDSDWDSIVIKHACYQSVAIPVGSFPVDNIMDELRSRAVYFSQHRNDKSINPKMYKYEEPFNITGFRFITQWTQERTITHFPP